MSTSSDASDAEAAEILQNSIYYNYDILDSALTVMAQYKDQSIAYLDSVVHFAYVLLRMLEKYSKNKGFMYVRKKKARRAVRKRKEDATEAGKEVPEEYVDEEEVAGVMEGDKDLPSYAEHQFTFTAFEQVSKVVWSFCLVADGVEIRTRGSHKYAPVVSGPLQGL